MSDTFSIPRTAEGQSTQAARTTTTTSRLLARSSTTERYDTLFSNT